MTLYIPTIRNIINSTVVAINEHELIKNPPIYYPIPDSNGNEEQIKVARYRNFDGQELVEPGLTISVFPSRKAASGSLPVQFKPYTLGSKEGGFQYEVTLRLAVSVHYQDVALEQNSIFSYTVSSDNYKVINHDNVTKKGAKKILKNLNENFTQQKTIAVEINPGEEIIRDYLFLLKYVLDANTLLLPWSIKSSEIESIDLPTTEWDKTSTNIYFHYGYLVWNLTLYLPGSLREITAPKVDTISTTLQKMSSIISY